LAYLLDPRKRVYSSSFMFFWSLSW
jgi:hypothetical protein